MKNYIVTLVRATLLSCSQDATIRRPAAMPSNVRSRNASCEQALHRSAMPAIKNPCASALGVHFYSHFG